MKLIICLSTLTILSLVACQLASTPKGFTDLDVAAFQQKMTEPGSVLLDVRTPEETALGKIDNCTEIDYTSANFEAEVEKLDKNKTYLVYCQSSVRSRKACGLMAQKGFKNLYNLKGGYQAWTEKN